MIVRLPRWHRGKESACQHKETPETQVQSLGQEMATHSSILPGKSHGQRSLAWQGTVHGTARSHTRLSVHACARAHTHTHTHTHTHMVVVRQEIFGSQAEQMEFTPYGQKFHNRRINGRII